MKPTCDAVRAALLDALEGGRPPLLQPHHRAHLATCEGCRNLCGEEEALDALLDLATGGTAHGVDLERLLARLRDSLDGALWAALDRIPEPPPPSPDLLARVLEAARAEDRDTLRDVELEPVPARPRWVRPLLAAAAAAVLAWVGLRDAMDVTPAPLAELEDPELLAWLDVLESWDELEALEPVELEALAVLDPGDALLMEWGGGQ
jgi:hypothetical protein